MSKKNLLWLTAALFVFIGGFTEERGMAQFTKEFIFCLDGSSPEACRGTEVYPNEDGVVIWGRDYGKTICVGVGFEPQETDCLFRGASYAGFECERSPFPFSRLVSAGFDMAVTCGDLSPLRNGEYSAKASSSSCFDGESPCGNFIVVDIAPSGP